MNDSIRILYVDDDPDFADLTAIRLEREDDRFEVESATEASDGLERLQNEEFDCVVSDYDMPGKDGMEFLQSVRQSDPDFPFVLFTGKGSEEIASEAISAGVTEYVQKKTGSEQYELLANRISAAASQYRTERRLERQNDLFAKAQNLANVGAWEYDVQSDRSYISDEVKRIHGLDVNEELTPEGSLEYYHPEDRETIEEAFKRAKESGDPYDLNLRLIDSDNRQRWVRTQGMPQMENGDVFRIRGTLQDVTEQTHREHQLERQNERLEEFAHVVSHDLRSPLQVASGKLELAKQTGQEEHFEAVESAHERIEAIIEDVLTLAQQGKEIGETEEIQLRDVVERAWKTVNTSDIDMHIVAGYELEADPDRLQQLFENLFRNAAEHAGPGTTVSIGPIDPIMTTTREEGESADGFYVSDDGPGIQGAQKNRLFESGYTTNEDGTGFGLAIVEQIADAHGWKAEVKDSPTGGVRFEFFDRYRDSV
jgi:PAS domain S-box-containing protein